MHFDQTQIGGEQQATLQCIDEKSTQSPWSSLLGTACTCVDQLSRLLIPLCLPDSSTVAGVFVGWVGQAGPRVGPGEKQRDLNTLLTNPIMDLLSCQKSKKNLIPQPVAGEPVYLNPSELDSPRSQGAPSEGTRSQRTWSQRTCAVVRN